MRTWPRAIVSLVSVGVVAAALAAGLRWDRLEDPSEDLDPGPIPETEEPLAAVKPRRIVLRPPRRAIPLGPVSHKDSAFKTHAYAYAFRYRSEVFETASAKPEIRGYVRRGTHLRVGKRVYGPGCKGGSWYPVAGGGYVCTKQGFVVATTKKEARIQPEIRQRPARLGAVLPYRYAKVKKQGSPRLYRLPTPDEEKILASAAAGKAKWPEVVDKPMKGIFFVALDRIEGERGRYYRTIRGRYVRKDHLDPRKTPPMRGELLGKGSALPIAFVYDEDRKLLRLEGGKLRRAGTAKKHARFHVKRTFEHGGKRYVEGPDHVVLPLDSVRVARRIERPDRIPAGARWIHVDLSEQSLVAYQDSTPLFATLVSSGKKGFEPPIGVFRVVSKHVSITMNGPDPDDGWYEVEDVPWTMYYWESYALHGAYWHNDFGKVRSHGCTNIAPADARWLFRWSSPELDEGLHGKLGQGTHVTFTS